MNAGTGLAILIALLPIVGMQPAFAQSSDELKALRKDVDALKEGQSTVQKQLQELLNLLRGGEDRQVNTPRSPRDLVLSVEGAPFKGRPEAKVTLIDFTDYQ